MPFLWVLLLLLLALFLKSRVWKRRSLILALSILIIFSNQFLANEAWRAWEADATPVHSTGKYDAAIILTGLTTFKAEIPDRVHTNKGADRVLHPLQLYRLGKIDKFIISGGNGSIVRQREPEAEQLKTLLLLAGVPETAIITETESRNTRENAVNVAGLLPRYPDLRKLLLVTSAFHMRRAEGCFQKAGVTADTYSTDFYTSERRLTPDVLIIPDINSFSRWHLLIHEIAGYIIYKLLGYC